MSERGTKCHRNPSSVEIVVRFVVGCATLSYTNGVILFDLSAGPEFSLLQFKLRDSLEMSAIALRLEAHSHLFKLNRKKTESGLAHINFSYHVLAISRSITRN